MTLELLTGKANYSIHFFPTLRFRILFLKTDFTHKLDLVGSSTFSTNHKLVLAALFVHCDLPLQFGSSPWMKRHHDDREVEFCSPWLIFSLNENHVCRPFTRAQALCRCVNCLREMRQPFLISTPTKLFRNICTSSHTHKQIELCPVQRLIKAPAIRHVVTRT